MDNKLSPEHISGGTTTLSNIGAIGGRYGSPLLNLPEVSVIAVGRIKKVLLIPQIADDGVHPIVDHDGDSWSSQTNRSIKNFSKQSKTNPLIIRFLLPQDNIGAHHRVLDRATVAKFCNEGKRFIENPELMTLHMRWNTVLMLQKMNKFWNSSDYEWKWEIQE